MRIQRIIFILIHLPFPFFSLPCLSPLFSSLLSQLPHTLWSLEPFLRLSDPRFILVKRERAANEREGEREREKEREATTTEEGRNQEGHGGKKERGLSASISPGSFVFLMSRRIWFVNCETSRVIDSLRYARGSGGQVGAPSRYLELKRFFGDTGHQMKIYCETVIPRYLGRDLLNIKKRLATLTIIRSRLVTSVASICTRLVHSNTFQRTLKIVRMARVFMRRTFC